MRSYSVTQMLFELGLPSFSTVLCNGAIVINRMCNASVNKLIINLNLVTTSVIHDFTGNTQFERLDFNSIKQFFVVDFYVAVLSDLICFIRVFSFCLSMINVLLLLSVSMGSKPAGHYVFMCFLSYELYHIISCSYGACCLK